MKKKKMDWTQFKFNLYLISFDTNNNKLLRGLFIYLYQLIIKFVFVFVFYTRESIALRYVCVCVYVCIGRIDDLKYIICIYLGFYLFVLNPHKKKNKNQKSFIKWCCCLLFKLDFKSFITIIIIIIINNNKYKNRRMYRLKNSIIYLITLNIFN